MDDAPLLTAVIVRKDAGWMIWWDDIASFSPGGAFQTLDWLAEATDSLLRGSGGAFQSLDELIQATDALVLSRDPTGEGCLQYKIYPWGRTGIGDERASFDVFVLSAPGTDTSEADPEARPHTSFNIWGSPGDLQADEIVHGGSIEVHGRTAEEVVNRVTEIRGERPDAFTWIRDIRSLRHAE
jgi:hypothetical protein